MRRLGEIVVLVLAVVWFTWPLAVRGWGHAVYPGGPSPDVLLVAWILAWDTHALGTHPLSLFDANTFYPAWHSLAFSESLLGSLPLFAPVWALTGNAIGALNVMTFVGFLLVAGFAYALGHAWTGSRLAALSGALAFALEAPRLGALRVPHDLATYWLPLIVLFVDRALWTGGRRIALGAAAVLVMQTLCSFYLGYIGFLAAGAVVASHLLVRGRSAMRALARVALPLLLAPLVIAPLGWVYATTLATNLGTADVHLALLATVNATLGMGGVAWVIVSKRGWAVCLLALAGLASLRRCDRQTTVRILALVTIAMLAFALAPGPGAPVYDVMLAVVPGFDRLRVPLRFEYLLSVALSGLIAYAVAAVPRRWRPVAAAGAFLVVVTRTAGLDAATAWPVPARAAFPESYQWLAQHGEGEPVLELPMGSPGAMMSDARAMYYSTLGWWPLLNGYTGYQPPSDVFVRGVVRRLPRVKALKALVDCTGVRWIVLRACDYRRLAPWWGIPGIILRARPARGGDEPPDCLFEVTRVPEAPCQESWPSRRTSSSILRRRSS